jgi:hypothetical protein
MKVPAAAFSMACPPPTEPVKLTKSTCPPEISSDGVMVEHDVLEHASGTPASWNASARCSPDLKRLGGVLEDDRVAGHQRRRDRVDRGHVGVVPRRDDQHDAVWRALDLAAEGIAVLDTSGASAPRRSRHVGHAFVEAAILAAIADRPAHLVRQLSAIRRSLADDLVGAQHQRNALVNGRAAQASCAHRARSAAAASAASRDSTSRSI